ncbi:MAG TPA: sulfatase [Chitinophagaceae bacterium]|nr:sulfatase [Chitinophagaceae bacterium]
MKTTTLFSLLISSRKFLPGFFLLVFLQAQAQDRPNIIYIMADDLGYADLSCYGRKDYQTPHLDKLAAQGVKFMNAYAAAPVCTPTRVAFMTGRYPASVPVGLKEPLAWNAKDSAMGLPPGHPTIASRLKNAGYKTFLIGKWHLGFKPEFSPLHYGFDYFYGFNGGGVDYISHGSPRGGATDLYENYQPVNTEGYMTDLLQQKTIDVIRRTHAKPFFISLMFSAPHWPWQAPGDKAYPDTMNWVNGGSAATYAAMVKSMDEAVGAIMKALDEQNLANNTVIIFTSDNGGDERFSDMGIYKGKKMQLWEGGIREPAIVRWPTHIKPGSTTNQVATTMDWTASILSLANAKPDPQFATDGIDLMPILTGKKEEISRTLYWRLFQRTQHKAMRDGKWKYLQDEKGQEYLFDLEADPSEKNNLKDKEAAVLLRLQQKYAAWEAGMLKPIPL